MMIIGIKDTESYKNSILCMVIVMYREDMRKILDLVDGLIGKENINERVFLNWTE